MSNNFESLKQIERDSCVGDDRHVDEIARPAKKRFNSTDKVSVTAWQEEILRLVQRVFLSANGTAPRLVVFCGVDGESGSSSVCACAGRTLASESSRAVCLIDANARSPRLSNIFRVDTKIPYRGKSASVREQCTQIDDNLWFTGVDMLTDDRGTLPSLDELKQRLTQLRSAFEYVLIDAPGTSICANAAHLGQVADASILVIEANITRRLSARSAKESLDAAGVRLLGTVLHNRSFPIPEKLYNRL